MYPEEALELEHSRLKLCSRFVARFFGRFTVSKITTKLLTLFKILSQNQGVYVAKLLLHRLFFPRLDWRNFERRAQNYDLIVRAHPEPHPRVTHPEQPRPLQGHRTLGSIQRNDGSRSSRRTASVASCLRWWSPVGSDLRRGSCCSQPPGRNRCWVCDGCREPFGDHARRFATARAQPTTWIS